MGGSIHFTSEAGKGALFSFRLKFDRAYDIPPARALSPVLAGPRDRLKILTVEDNPINRRLLERQLEKLGIANVAVSDGRAALELIAKNEFGLVLLDCQMPELDGYQTAAQIRSFEAGRSRIPIVAITANTTEDDRRKCLEAGMDDFVPKPISLEILSNIIQKWDRPFDETALSAFIRITADDSSQAARLLDDFIADAATHLSTAHAALSRDDRAILARECHCLKGAAAAVGARGLRELCQRLDEAAAKSETPILESLLLQADAEYQRLRTDLASRRAFP